MASPRPSSYPTPSSPKNQGFSAGEIGGSRPFSDANRMPKLCEGCRIRCILVEEDERVGALATRPPGRPGERDVLDGPSFVPPAPPLSHRDQISFHCARITFPVNGKLEKFQRAGHSELATKMQLRPDGAGPPLSVPNNAGPTSAIYLLSLPNSEPPVHRRLLPWRIRVASSQQELARPLAGVR
jgi:hypothetical protein